MQKNKVFQQTLVSEFLSSPRLKNIQKHTLQSHKLVVRSAWVLRTCAWSWTRRSPIVTRSRMSASRAWVRSRSTSAWCGALRRLLTSFDCHGNDVLSSQNHHAKLSLLFLDDKRTVGSFVPPSSDSPKLSAVSQNQIHVLVKRLEHSDKWPAVPQKALHGQVQMVGNLCISGWWGSHFYQL